MKTTQRIAEILIPEGIDSRGRTTTIPTAYGKKSREGIAALIEEETRLPGLIGALESLVRSKESGERILSSQWACARAALSKAKGA